MTSRKRLSACTAVSMLCASLSGCSFLAPSSQKISIATAPPGAQVTINGNQVGATPLVFQAQRDQELSILMTKEGYQPAVRHTQQFISNVGIVDLLGGSAIVLPFLGLLSNGAWKQSPANIAVTLEPKKQTDKKAPLSEQAHTSAVQ